MDKSSFLMVERGNPYERGDVIALTKPITVLGRKGQHFDPDIAFDNIFVSRRHAALLYRNGKFSIKDLNSKHGTFVNQKRLDPHDEIPLQHGDTIVLAGDLIVLSFSILSMDETMDITPLIKQLAAVEASGGLRLNPFKQELVYGEDVYAFSEKEYKCMELLVNHQGQFVSKDQLKVYIWPERSCGTDEVPDVSSEELNALIYRVRKKTRGILDIESIRGKGYILQTQADGQT
ncbi:FHA domain-containing protein [Virgibacillus sp. LDC1]|uniref:FHA domain-containing protein n=2 Tax=Paenibacillus lautus TaxID=1401 RepID=UPI002DB7EDE6|nr:FHA domain-containing protein [Paenibacillus lautus]MCV4235153.1 FHA domain-containing protein [Virgibacillus sp. LDC1]MEC0201028.1 FHA domain-containing protein [Paenibacillus lautus]